MTYTTFLILSFLIAAISMFLGILIGRQYDDEAEVEGRDLPVMLRKQAD